MHPHAALRVWRRLVQGLCTVGCAVWGSWVWLAVVQRCFSPLTSGCFVSGSGLGCTRSISSGCLCAVRVAMPVAMPAWMVHPAH